MKKLLPLLFVFIAPFCAAQEYAYNHLFFSNSAMQGNYFFSLINASGGSSIQNTNGKLPVSEGYAFTPGNALQLTYASKAGGKWQAMLFRQNKRGMNHFTGARFLSLWVSVSNTNTTQHPPLVSLVKKDSSLTTSVPLKLKPGSAWQQVIIPLKEFSAPAIKPQNIIAIAFLQNGTSSTEETMYIDEVSFTDAQKYAAVKARPVIETAKGYAAHVDISWHLPQDTNLLYVKIYRSSNGKNFKAAGIQEPYINRYADFTGEEDKKYFYKIAFIGRNYKETAASPVVTARTRSMTDDELLTMVQEASFRYYWDGAEQYSGLAKENISGRHNMIATGASGFGMMALLVGAERNFISRQEAVERFLKITSFLSKADRFHGVYPHFLDGPTGKVEPFFGRRDNGADLVETSFLMQGLLAARQFFSGEAEEEKQIRTRITSIWESTEWNWFRRYDDGKYLFWHWSPTQGWVINHRLIGWNETMITYLLAIASPTHHIPAEMYYTGWASQDSIAQKYRAAWGKTNDGSMYSNGNTYYGIKLDVGVSNGGPLFFTHYSFMGYNPHDLTDRYTNYFTNNQAIANINLRYCIENPKQVKGYGDSAWGLTASDGPFHYSADEPVPAQDHGKIAPTGAIASFPYTPEASMRALKNYYFNYGHFLWGAYGFKDAFDLEQNWCSEIYMGLNQAPMTVMIENYRTGLIWKLFMQDKDVQQGLQKLQAIR